MRCLNKILLAVTMLFASFILKAADESAVKGVPSDIKHTFIGIDESRGQVIYVDQNDSKKNWNLTLPEKCRDYQLIGKNRLLLSGSKGYYEYDLATREKMKSVTGYLGTVFARRKPDGTTIIGGNKDKGIIISVLDASDALVNQFKCDHGNARLGRLTPQGTLLVGSDNKIIELDLEGKVLMSQEIPDGKHIYQVLRNPDKHMLVSMGYGAAAVELDETGKVLKALGGKTTEDAKKLGFNFFSGFQVLKNGNVVLANWTGHGVNDSSKGVQLVEFDKSGKVVWTWHDPVLAGTLHGVIVLDDLDTQVLNDDVSSVLGPCK